MTSRNSPLLRFFLDIAVDLEVVDGTALPVECGGPTALVGFGELGLAGDVDKDSPLLVFSRAVFASAPLISVGFSPFLVVGRSVFEMTVAYVPALLQNTPPRLGAEPTLYT